MHFDQGWSEKKEKSAGSFYPFCPTTDAILNFFDNSVYSGKNFALSFNP